MKIHLVLLFILSLFSQQVSAQQNSDAQTCESFVTAYQDCVTEVQTDPSTPEDHLAWCSLAWSTLVRPNEEYNPVTCQTYCEYFQIKCIPCMELAESMYNCYAGEECDASDCVDADNGTNDGASNNGNNDMTNNGDSATESCPKVTANVETSFQLYSDQAGCQPHPYLGTCVPCFTTPGTSSEFYKVTVTNDVPGRFAMTRTNGGFAWGEDSAGGYMCSNGDEQILFGEFVEGATVNVLAEEWDIPQCDVTEYSGYVQNSASMATIKTKSFPATIVAAALFTLFV